MTLRKIGTPTLFYRAVNTNNKNKEKNPKHFHSIGKNASEYDSNANFIEFLYAELKHVFLLEKHVDYEKIKEFCEKQNRSEMSKKILLSVNWNHNDEWIPVSQSNIDDGIYKKIKANAYEIVNQPEFNTVFNSSDYDSIAYINENDEEVFIFSESLEVKPFFEKEKFTIDRSVMLLANNFSRKYKKENELNKKFRNLVKGIFLNQELSEFLLKSGIENNILITKGDKNTPGGENRVKSAISVGKMILDMDPMLKGEEKGIYISRKEYLSGWNIIVAEEKNSLPEEPLSMSY